MAVEQLSPQPAPSARQTSEYRYPKYSLMDSLAVAKAIYSQGGGACDLEHLATYLGYKGTNNGAFASKVGASRMFQFVQKSGELFRPTQLAHRILSPVYAHDAKAALVEAFMNVELFKKIHDDFKGKELPPDSGLKNAMRMQYGVPVANVDVAYRNLIESADAAGFFAARNGAKTHLILPMIHTDGAKPDDSLPGGGGGGGGSGGAGNPPPPPPPPPPGVQSMTDVKAQYLSTLIKLFESKSANGEVDEKLMERIERLLNGQ